MGTARVRPGGGLRGVPHGSGEVSGMDAAGAVRADWARVARVLRHRPMVREGDEPAERVAAWELSPAADGGTVLRLTTYAGRTVTFGPLAGCELRAVHRDSQGVAVAWELVLRLAGGTARRLALFT